jgi:pyridoxine/pyridoxamine 5'-phosphate oxidase
METNRYTVEIPDTQDDAYFSAHIRDAQTGDTRSKMSGPHANREAMLADLTEFCDSLNEQERAN